ncbi:hypothetical protein SCAR479_13619 [Seiridium cardinale]|uniref:Uncharacterized protein n=1 Tax=Seiridium cardinale TaxID=138064 RepID=A0ABR2X7C5_9PEZI
MAKAYVYHGAGNMAMTSGAFNSMKWHYGPGLFRASHQFRTAETANDFGAARHGLLNFHIIGCESPFWKDRLAPNRRAPPQPEEISLARATSDWEHDLPSFDVPGGLRLAAGGSSLRRKQNFQIPELNEFASSECLDDWSFTSGGMDRKEFNLLGEVDDQTYERLPFPVSKEIRDSYEFTWN